VPGQASSHAQASTSERRSVKRPCVIQLSPGCICLAHKLQRTITDAIARVLRGKGGPHGPGAYSVARGAGTRARVWRYRVRALRVPPLWAESSGMAIRWLIGSAQVAGMPLGNPRCVKYQQV
jgi:hypothetical protein